MITRKLIAWATTSTNTVGADPGISVMESVTEDGVLVEQNDLADSTMNPGDADGDLDTDKADSILETLGFGTDGPWTRSDGQWAVEVERI